jgi:hypothetical protein
MMNADQIFQAIQGLSLSERRKLLDRLNRDSSTAPAAPTEQDEDLDLIGFLADDPDLADEIEKIATVERAGQDMRSWDGAAGAPR